MLFSKNDFFGFGPQEMCAPLQTRHAKGIYRRGMPVFTPETLDDKDFQDMGILIHSLDSDTEYSAVLRKNFL